MSLQYPFRLNAVASLFAAGAAAASPVPQETAPAPLAAVVVVSGSRVEHTSFDLPAAIDVDRCGAHPRRPDARQRIRGA